MTPDYQVYFRKQVPLNIACVTGHDTMIATIHPRDLRPLPSFPSNLSCFRVIVTESGSSQNSDLVLTCDLGSEVTEVVIR